LMKKLNCLRVAYTEGRRRKGRTWKDNDGFCVLVVQIGCWV
jgi:hypothetical protein